MFTKLRNLLFGEPAPVRPTISYELVRRPSRTILEIMIEYNTMNRTILTINEITNLDASLECWEKLYKGTSETFIRICNASIELGIDVRSELTIFTLDGLVMYVPTTVALPVLKSLHEELKK